MGVGVLVPVSIRVSVTVGLENGTFVVGICSTCSGCSVGARKLQVRINPTKTRLKGMSA